MRRNLPVMGLALGAPLLAMGCVMANVRDDLVLAEAVQAVGSELVVYDDALGAGWASWSWSTSIDPAATSPVQSGARALAVTYQAAWAGLYLRSSTAIDPASHDTVRFWIHGGASGGQKVKLQLRDGAGNAGPDVAVGLTAGQWTQVDVALSSLGSPALITGLVWREVSNSSQPDLGTFYLDRIALVSAASPPPPPVPALSVDVAAGRRAISPDIYGIDNASEALAGALRLPVRRWGGNSKSRYNYLLDTANRGSDWYFENVPETNADPAALPTGSAADRFVEQDRRTGTTTLLTVPLIGWLPKARAYACGFSVSKYGAQQDTDDWRPDCGNGVGSNGNPITGNDPLDTSVAIDPSFVQGWVQHLISRFGTAAQGGVAYYNLDNEPMLWNDTHRDVHPQPASYDEIRDRTHAYAAAIKAADPGARTLGPVAWGWEEYFYSALDRVVTAQCQSEGKTSWWQCRQDRMAHGDVAFVPWYLQQMLAYQQQHGVRILDYLDLHYYPEASGVSRRPATGQDNEALRLRATRSLWDPTYVDESWIAQSVRLIPRMRDWVAQNYPGTRLAISEYNFGALDHINGALAQADALGIFGREGVDLATLWWYHYEHQPTFEPSHPGAFAFRMYRNYDGAGSGFGETGVQASSTDQGRLAVYAAERASDGALTLMVINKTAEPLTSALALSNASPDATARVYRYSAANLGAIVREADLPVTSSGFT
ncbi:MAG TPA: glycoside hydrolase family 44 protein, partial [Haliangium sp.]|nr:glycoside hydrolase family 44 protein [Haliangium sp.]